MEAITNLVSQITSANVHDLPSLLLKLREYAISAHENDKTLAEVCEGILLYKLLPLITGILKQDITKFEGKIVTAVKLSDTLRLLLVCLSSSNVDPRRYHAHLPGSINCFLQLLLNIQGSFKTTKNIKERSVILRSFNEVLKNTLCVVQLHKFLLHLVVSYPGTHEMLIKSTGNSDKTFGPFVSFLATCFEHCDISQPFKSKSISVILDELVYRLSATDDSIIIESCLKCLINLAQNDTNSLSILKSQYKGLTKFINKFEDPNINDYVEKLTVLLKGGKIQTILDTKRNNAATVIQAHYRGYQTRKLLQALNKSFAKFQRIYRNHLKEKRDEEVQHLNKIESQHNKDILLKQTIRKKNQEKLEVLSLMPAAKVEQFLSNQQENAANRIQAAWKGYNVRKKLNGIKVDKKKLKAACVIQSKVRDWLENKHLSKKQLSTVLNLSDAEVEGYQKVIDSWQEKHKVVPQSHDELQDLFQTAQKSLHNFYITLPSVHRSLDHCLNLCTQLELCPSINEVSKLDDITEEDGKLLKCSSSQISADAKKTHLQYFKHFNDPWWIRLDRDEVDNPF